MLFPLHNYFIIVLMSEPQGEPKWFTCPIQCRTISPIWDFTSDNRIILRNYQTCPFLLICLRLSVHFRFYLRNKPWKTCQVLIKPFPTRSGAHIQSFPSHPSKSGGGFNMCWVVIVLYLCSSVHQGKKISQFKATWEWRSMSLRQLLYNWPPLAFNFSSL